jgi:hypothetical protein
VFYYYGGKRMLARQWGPPAYPLIIEPFAGSAGYSMYWLDSIDEVWLIEKDKRVVDLWHRLMAMTSEDILALEPPEAGVYTDDFLWMTAATSNAIANIRKLKMPERVPRIARMMLGQIAQRLPMVQKKVTMVHRGDYTDAPDVEATWFIDPPYQVNGSASPTTRFPQGMGYAPDCKSEDLDYGDLARWCRARRGQVVVCEQRGATWLPFTSLDYPHQLELFPDDYPAEVTWRNEWD